MFTIKDMSTRFGLTFRALRFYEQKHLIHPERTDTHKRLYSAEDVARIERIAKWRAADFTVQEIRQLLSLVDAGNEVEVERIEARITSRNTLRATNLLRAIESLREPA